jgi:hypothetical protein
LLNDPLAQHGTHRALPRAVGCPGTAAEPDSCAKLRDFESRLPRFVLIQKAGLPALPPAGNHQSTHGAHASHVLAIHKRVLPHGQSLSVEGENGLALHAYEGAEWKSEKAQCGWAMSDNRFVEGHFLEVFDRVVIVVRISASYEPP